MATEEAVRLLTAREINHESKASLLIRLMLEGETLRAASEEAELSTRQARRILNRPENQAALRAALVDAWGGASDHEYPEFTQSYYFHF